MPELIKRAGEEGPGQGGKLKQSLTHVTFPNLLALQKCPFGLRTGAFAL